MFSPHRTPNPNNLRRFDLPLYEDSQQATSRYLASKNSRRDISVALIVENIPLSRGTMLKRAASTSQSVRRHGDLQGEPSSPQKLISHRSVSLRRPQQASILLKSTKSLRITKLDIILNEEDAVVCKTKPQEGKYICGPENKIKQREQSIHSVHRFHKQDEMAFLAGTQRLPQGSQSVISKKHLEINGKVKKQTDRLSRRRRSVAKRTTQFPQKIDGSQQSRTVNYVSAISSSFSTKKLMNYLKFISRARK